MAVTQKQIAHELGISHQLVSFALNGNGNVAPKTRDEIVATAERLGYRRNELARAMVTGKSSALGFLSFESDQSDHLMRVLSGAIDAANEHQLFIKAMHYRELSDIRGVLERCLEWRVAGLMVMNLTDEAVETLEHEVKQLDMPVAFIENPPSHPADVWVRSDDYHGLQQIIEHLTALGHREIAFFNGNAESRLSEKRETHFRRVMECAGLFVNEAWLVRGSWGLESPLNEEAAQKLLAFQPRPTAVVCSGDPLAMILIREAQNAGLKLPQELSVTGFADFYLAGLSNPALTTVDQSFRVMGRVAVEQLLSCISATPVPNGQRWNQLLPTRLIVRASTAPPLCVPTPL
ncbi:catabolite control protein A [Abditibacteriota bacterium]|nr:catabolite control protein A [Abditibacteriota bacterium]